MESGPEFRIVGGASDETVDKVLTDIDDAFSKNEGPLAKKPRKFAIEHGIEKTPEIIEIIRYANEYTNKLLLQHGIEPYDIPDDNIYALKPEDYSILSDNNGAFALTLSQMIVINANNSLTKTSATTRLIHEMLHLKGHKTIQIENNEHIMSGRTISNYRIGVVVESSQSAKGFHEHFKGLNESIVATLEVRAIPYTLQQPGYEKDKAEFDSPEAQNYLELLKNAGTRIDDINSIRKIGDRWSVTHASYPRHREVFDFIVEKIFEDNADTYENTEDVYKLFFDAHFSGKLLTIARLVEHSFGEGSFRTLGNMGADFQSARTHLDTFQKLYRKNHS